MQGGGANVWHALQSERAELARCAAELADLQRQLSVDALTGLPTRAAFRDALQARLTDVRSTGRALLLLRVPQLDLLNLRLGRDTTDHLLAGVGHLLLTYVDRVPGACAGRLNGSDFALYLPVAGVAAETAQSLRVALSALGSLRSASVETAVGGVDRLPCLAPGSALAEADAALARAEAGEGGGVVIDAHVDLQVAAQGAGAWRLMITEALARGRLQLQEQAVLDCQGQLVHLACAPRLRLTRDGTWVSPQLSGAMARRSGLLAELEFAAVRAALQCCADDGRQRALCVGAATLNDPARVDALTALLRRTPAQAHQLSLLLKGAQDGRPSAAMLAASSRWHGVGVRVGVAVADLRTEMLPELAGHGLGYALIDAQLLRGLPASRHPSTPGSDDPRWRCASSLVTLLRGLGLAVMAQEPLEARDLPQAWALGLDAVAATSTELATDYVMSPM